MIKRNTMLFVVTLIALGTGAFADEGRNESGKGEPRYASRDKRESKQEGKGEEHRDRERDDRREGRREGDESYFQRHGYTRLGIPEGHLPSPGECRIWYPGRSPGQQPPPGRCELLRGEVPPGAWLISRAGREPQHVEVAVYDVQRRGVVIDVGVFDAHTGSIVRILGSR